MKRFRKVLFWLHLVIGLAAGGTIAITTFTGATMAFEKQFIAWAERDLRRVTPPAANAERMPVDELLRRVREIQPDARPMGLTVSVNPADVVIINLGRTNAVYANPYTGEFQPQGAPKLRAFFQLMLRWHRWLGVNPPPAGEGGTDRPGGAGLRAGGDAGATPAQPRAPGGLREIMSTVVGASAAVFLTLCASGLYLWWPRSWSWKKVRPVSVMDFRLRGKARDFNWHNAIGLWSAPVLIVMSFTGMVMAFRGFGNFVYGPQPGGPGGPGSASTNTVAISASAPGARPLGYDALIAVVQQEVPDWETITLRLGAGRQRGPGGTGERRREGAERGEEAGGRLRGEVGERGGRSEARGPQPVSATVRELGSRLPVPMQLQLDPFTGAVLKREVWGEQGFRRAMRQLNRTLHTGEAGGWLGQTLALLACLGGLTLVYTGFALAWRRFFRPVPAPATLPVADPVA